MPEEPSVIFFKGVPVENQLIGRQIEDDTILRYAIALPPQLFSL
jgi:hypothetical protein